MSFEQRASVARECSDQRRLYSTRTIPIYCIHRALAGHGWIWSPPPEDCNLGCWTCWHAPAAADGSAICGSTGMRMQPRATSPGQACVRLFVSAREAACGTTPWACGTRGCMCLRQPGGRAAVPVLASACGSIHLHCVCHVGLATRLWGRSRCNAGKTMPYSCTSCRDIRWCQGNRIAQR